MSVVPSAEAVRIVPISCEFSPVALIDAQTKDSELLNLKESAVDFEESQAIAEGFYLKDDVLMPKWRLPE